jgi:hypothetical protein
MRKSLALLAAVAALFLTVSSSFAAENKIVQPFFRRNLATRALPVDSIAVNFASLVGAASSETTVAIPTADWDFDSPTGVAFTTSQPIARLFITGTSAFAGDSIYYAVDVSADGSNWMAGTLTGLAPTTALDKMVNAVINIDSDAVGVNLWRVPFIRIRLFGDSGGVANAGVSLRLAYPGRSRFGSASY